MLNEELLQAIADEVAAGATLQAAARSAGVSARSLRRWRQAGRQELDELGFAGRLELALERATTTSTAGDWRSAAAWLEEGWPEVYALD